MPDYAQLTPNALISSIGEKLKLNPLLWSLFALSPADALDYLGVWQAGGWIEARRAVSDADRAQVTQILDALGAGHTSLDIAQSIEAVPSAFEPSAGATPSAPVPLVPDYQAAHAHQRPAPDITLIVARTTLEYALQRYAQHQFIGQTFQLAPQPWLEVVATGAAIALELDEGNARLVAHLDATFSGNLQIVGRRVSLFTRRSPIEIDLSAVFSVNAGGQLCVGVGPGSVRVPGLPLPATLIDMLYARIREMVSAVPIMYLPTRFDLPEAAELIADEVQLQLSTIVVAAQAVTLEFQLFFGPNAGVSTGRTNGIPSNH